MPPDNTPATPPVTPPATPPAGTPPVTPPAVPPAPPPVDVEKIKADLAADFGRRLKEATGFDSLDKLAEEKLKQKGDFEKLAEQRAQEAATWRTRFEASTAQAVITAAAAEAGAVDASVVTSLVLAGEKPKVADDGTVTIGGKSPLEAVKKLLTEKPFLAKAVGGSGSGAPATVPGSANKPTLTRAQFDAASPADRAAHIKAGGTVTD